LVAAGVALGRWGGPESLVDGIEPTGSGSQAPVGGNDQEALVPPEAGPERSRVETAESGTDLVLQPAILEAPTKAQDPALSRLLGLMSTAKPRFESQKTLMNAQIAAGYAVRLIMDVEGTSRAVSRDHGRGVPFPPAGTYSFVAAGHVYEFNGAEFPVYAQLMEEERRRRAAERAATEEGHSSTARGGREALSNELASSVQDLIARAEEAVALHLRD
jgi:hypothetical protein